MSITAMKLCSMILQENFGDVVRTVGDDLFCTKSRTIYEIIKKTNLSRKQVTSSLAILTQYRLVSYSSIENNEQIAEYMLHYDKILLFLRYPRYMYFIQKKKGDLGALLLEELLRSGMAIAHSVIIQAYANTDVKNDQTLIELRDTFIDMVGEKFFIRCPEMSDDPVPKILNEKNGNFQVSNIEIKEIKQLIDSNKDPENVVSEKVYWTVNFDKLHQCFRDKVLIDAIERQIDANAAECFQFIISLMYKTTEAWEPVSNAISIGEIKRVIEKKSNNTELLRHLEQYVSIIEKDECGFLKKDETGNAV
ncbi:hypothetical protein PVAND_010822 [Polypedilum vanderplanki]|uniref:DNA-directed RNA polymerase III subunit RPC3 n=1 Tax=Polypedilum vanderplanki TaxID=319348 RepID=A0A9J6CH56_POLVA|nr:hypothetical protein PVAND_010822 [Polypedilum vanderplanki]